MSGRQARREARGLRSARASRGQALVWLLGTMAAAAAVLWGVYNIGQLTNGKQKAVNAADAAALAGATVEARTLNLMAYNNRSLIANEVFMIQTTALQGYMQYLSHTADNIEDYVKWIPYIGEVLSAILTTVEKVTAAIEKAMDVAIPAQVVVLEGLKKVTAATHGVLATTASLMADKAAADLVAANRAQFGSHMDAGVSVESRATVKTLTTAQNLLKWKAFTKRYSGSERKDAADVLLASRDKFTGGSRPGNSLLTPDLFFVGFTKAGDTRLVNYDRWETQDTYEFWYLSVCGKIPHPCTKYEAIGWGRGNLDKPSSRGSTWSPGRDAQKRAYREGHVHGGWSGVPALYDVADKSTSARETLGVDYMIAVRRERKATQTSSTMEVNKSVDAVTGDASMDEQLLGQQLSALGKARVYFERPQSGIGDSTAGALVRHDGAKEYGSLYDPYWQARLQDVSYSEKLAYMTALGMSPTGAAVAAKVTPGGQ
ncbi:pilus assembly protein TadG-related protein [Ideonella dechloratans]|uniref:pilus assembly protein TadG-related protein n=1 Tax=Ideonella dechloratans TaxID=36863 RepID=UPI0035B3556C